jgi:hypothetical protein
MRKLGWLVLLGTLPMFAGTTTARLAKPSDVGAAAASENPPPEHSVTAPQVHAILELTGSNTMGTADLEGAMVRSFQQHMSTEDAAQIIAFYESPAGKHMIAVMPKVLNEGQDAGAQLGQQVMFEVIQRHKDESNAAARLYHEEHPQNAPQH